MNPTWLSFFRAGAWSWVVVGAGHVLIVLGLPFFRISKPADRALASQMRGHTVNFLGLRRSLLRLNWGYSVVMGVVAACFGALNLLLASAIPDVVERIPRVIQLDLAASLFGPVMSIRVFPPPPILAFGVASISFALALCA